MKVMPFEKPIEILIKERDRWATYGRDTKHLDELITKQIEDMYNNLTPYQIVQIARHPERPQPFDYINALFSNFMELHGDRESGDDYALLGGIGLFRGTPVLIIGNRKGHDIKESIRSHSGMVSPSGFKKAARLVKLASDSLKVPVVTFIDTPGALISPESELNGQVAAIYKSISTFINADVPIISVITGEGGSLGALGIGIADRMLMLKFSFLTVVSPEIGSSVLFKNIGKSSEIAKQFNLTANNLLSLNIIDGIIEEPAGGAHRFKEKVTKRVGDAIQSELDFILKEPLEVIKKKRFEKFRKIGVYSI
ncbi:MAG: acetyl-CoA carboxylase carboxyl transferase subunit alpha [Nitrospiraceae bacterium]|nr:acetyl-CoA carboxylase carboxyl transferase subunit alpha [Nitrospiraceae bacterium]